jgi:hypothetical protein
MMITAIPNAPLRIPDAHCASIDAWGYPIGEWRSAGTLAKHCWFLI